MERKRKIKRASILAVFIYVMINGFVWGFMKAYLNSYNIISKDQLVMAEVNNNNSKTEIKILNKNGEGNIKNVISGRRIYKTSDCKDVLTDFYV